LKQDENLNLFDLLDVTVATILAHGTISTISADGLLDMMYPVLGREASKPELHAFLLELVHRRTLKREAIDYSNQMLELERQYQEARQRGDRDTAAALERRKVSVFVLALPLLTELHSMCSSGSQ